MKNFKKDNVIYYFSPDNLPKYFIEDGEEFWVETEDCYSGQIKTINDLRPNINISIMDASVGPIAINGAEVGDSLCVQILDIEVVSQGVMVTSPGLGILGSMINEATTRIIKIDNGYANFFDKFKIPINPMIGVLGVATEKDKIHCATPGTHGGNMDTKEIKVDSKVYLPVFVKGANLAIGDLHAVMGDGELSGTGVEIAGKVHLKVNVIKNMKLNRPRIEREEGIYMISSAEDFEEAIKNAVYDGVEYLKNEFNLDFKDAYRLVSAACDIRISQVVNPLVTIKLFVPNWIKNTII
ncbi:acetamidase/formamidase family protein [Clostridium peptidivorans]|uniref:acetamidase/formamidase family protein n=1 Tax=Clostridium peptidivorans TaxID=100174 RepID=UPI000BE2D9F2|nr:acetamidase/formamidase family protein [Clostridium peptidivorans]